MPSHRRSGVAYGLAAYGLWGLFPLFFHLLGAASAGEVVAHRILWSLVVCALSLTVIKGWRDLVDLLHAPRRLALVAAAAVAVSVNWGFYVEAVDTGHVIEASLGYYINPLVTVLLGVVVLRERLRPLQWTAVGVAAVAVTVLTVAYGRPPWFALVLAASFAGYGLLKNRLGGSVAPLVGLTAETLVLGPLAVAVVVGLEATGRGHLGGPAYTGALLAASGVVTVVPLVLFAASAARVPLATLGLLQYITPTLQLTCGVVVLGERMAASRWVGFGIVWLALALLAVDMLRTRRPGPTPDAEG